MTREERCVTQEGEEEEEEECQQVFVFSPQDDETVKPQMKS